MTRSVTNSLVGFVVFTAIWEVTVAPVMTRIFATALNSFPNHEYSSLFRAMATWIPHLPLIFLGLAVAVVVFASLCMAVGTVAPPVVITWGKMADYPRWYVGRRRDVHTRPADEGRYDVSDRCVCGREASSVEEYYDAVIVAGVPVCRLDAGAVPICDRCLSGSGELLSTSERPPGLLDESFDEEFENVVRSVDE